MWPIRIQSLDVNERNIVNQAGRCAAGGREKLGKRVDGWLGGVDGGCYIYTEHVDDVEGDSGTWDGLASASRERLMVERDPTYERDPHCRGTVAPYPNQSVMQRSHFTDRKGTYRN
jgi:hypothetical protein